MAKLEIVRDPSNAAKYLQTGIPRTYHNCARLKETCAVIEEMMLANTDPGKPRPLVNIKANPKQKSLFDFYPGKLRSRPSNSPPGTPRPSTSTSSLTGEESDDEDCVIIAVLGPRFAQRNEQKGARRAAPESPDDGQPRKKVRTAYNL